MPYIDTLARKRLAFQDTPRPENAGELNYVITTLCDDYLAAQGKRYGTMNEIMGVLACVGQEFYRRVAAPYEDGKVLQNGDVYRSDHTAHFHDFTQTPVCADCGVGVREAYAITEIERADTRGEE